MVSADKSVFLLVCLTQATLQLPPPPTNLLLLRHLRDSRIFLGNTKIIFSYLALPLM